MKNRKILAVLLALALVFAVPHARSAENERDAQLLSFIEALCTVNSIDSAMVLALIERESSWNVRAVNAKGNCLGLMQISTVHTERLRKDLGIEDLFDPYQNVMAGIDLLAGYLRRYGDCEMALMCYNCGEAGAQAHFSEGEYSSAYSRWIVDRASEIKKSR